MKDEVWKTVEGTHGLYEVSCMGCLRRTDKMRSDRWSSRGGVVSGYICKGYVMSTLCVRGHRRQVAIHQIVMEAFCGVPECGAEVNHKDFNKTNNTLENLEYVTHKENVHHAIRGGAWPDRFGSNNVNAILTDEAVVQIRKECKESNKKQNTRESLGLRYGVSPDTIKQAQYRKTWKHVG